MPSRWAHLKGHKGKALSDVCVGVADETDGLDLAAGRECLPQMLIGRDKGQVAHKDGPSVIRCGLHAGGLAGHVDADVLALEQAPVLLQCPFF